MNNFYYLLQVNPPSLIENQTNEVQLIYFFGTLIVLGLIGAITYLRSEIKKRDIVINQKNDEIRAVTQEAHESEKKNIVVLKDLVDLLDANTTTIQEIKEIITTKTNPNIESILSEVKWKP